MPFFSPDGANGGGYSIDPNQLNNLSLDESEVEQTYDEPEYGQDETELEEETQDGLFDLGDIGKVSIDEINQWRNGHMMQSDYTRKTQELAEMRRQLEEQFSPYQQLDDIFRQRPELEQQFIQMLEGTNEGGYAPQNQTNPLFTQLHQQNLALQEQMQMLQQAENQRQIQAEWNELFTTYPDAKEIQQQLAEFADQNGTNLINAYKLLNFDKVRTQTQTEMVKNQMKKKVANTLRTANPSGANEPKQKPLGYQNVVQHLLSQSLNLSE